MNYNSVKMYNKSGSLLRIETTINNTRDFKVFRRPNDDEGKPASWQKMRKGVSDLHRRCEVSQQCNDRYGDALAAAQVEEKLKEVVCGACNKVVKEGKRYRGLNPWQQDDYRMLMFLAKGENAINGFRNHDLRKWLYHESGTSRQGSAKEVFWPYDPTDKAAADTRPNPQSSAGQPLCFDGERPEVLLFADDSFSP